MNVVLLPIKRTDSGILSNMVSHYSQPKGFVGRNICYAVMFNNVRYGSIAGGSATRFLPNRKIIGGLNNGINNIFFHVEKMGGEYPARWFTAMVLAAYRATIEIDWMLKYGDAPLWHETLVEIPRAGNCYIKDGWTLVGQTKGFTCKRTKGQGTDSWSGKRVWDTKNLRPKHVFIKQVSQPSTETSSKN